MEAQKSSFVTKNCMLLNWNHLLSTFAKDGKDVNVSKLCWKQ